MNLADLRAFCANLLDWDPSNETYISQLNKLLNDAQSRVLTDRPWEFAQKEGIAQVYTDQTISVGVTNGSASVTTGASFPLSTSTILPGSILDGAECIITDSNGDEFSNTVAWVSATNALTFTSDFRGTTGTYNATFRMRDVWLPADAVTLMNVQDITDGLPRNQIALSQFEEDAWQYDRTMLGTPTAFIPFPATRIPAPRVANGIATVAGVGQGVRTINVYMVNVSAPEYPTPSAYREGVSGGRESGLSAVATYSLTALQTLTFTPETLPNVSGLYRRYYFTCPEAGIYAPVRIAGAVGSGTANRDTISPTGGVTLTPDLSLSYLQSQTFQTRAIKYVPSNGAYRCYRLYPHPSADSLMRIRYVRAPEQMLEDTDTPLIPEAHSQVIAYTALEQIATKLDNLPLAQSYMRKKDILLRGMEQRYLGSPPRRIVRGGMAGAYPPPWYGPVRFTP